MEDMIVNGEKECSILKSEVEITITDMKRRNPSG